jgi:r-opsin
MHVFGTTKSLLTPSNMLVMNLAFSDFFMLFTMAPPLIVNCFYETWYFGPFMCDLYGMLGSVWGCASIWSMTMIAFDRYVVIVKGLSAKPMTTSKALLEILFIWAFAILWTILPMVGWNRYVPEGNLTACGTDYLTKDWFSRSYILVYGFFVYFLPLIMIIYSYYHILNTVFTHEKSMREQAKKMNVASLRSTDSDVRTEFKLAKIALVTISLWFMAWTPYLVINFMGVFESASLSPLATIWGSVFAKANCVYNPIVYGISHPKYREALAKKYPRLCNATSDKGDSDSKSTTSTIASSSCEINVENSA